MSSSVASSAADASAVRRILVTRLRYLGDVILSTPVLEALRERCPEASIEYLCAEEYAPVLAAHPDVDRIHALPSSAGVAQTWRMARELRSPRVDWWVDLFGNPRSALLCLLARPRVSVGTDRGLRTRVFQHRMGTPPGSPSAVAHHLHKLLPLMGELAERPVSIAVTQAERSAIREALGLDSSRAPVLLHPGATWPSKAWPEAKWSQLIDALAAEGWGECWVLSAPGEEARSRGIVEQASADARVIEALGLRELLALVAEARAYIGNDGGILHAAIALGTPTVGIFGPTEAEIWFPHDRWGGARLAQEYVACRPCHLHHCDHLSCLEALPVSRVRQLLGELLGQPEELTASV